jgi:predicted CopG family antitoxin
LDIDQLEKEYFSEKIAEMIYPKENSSEFLKLAEQKAEYKKLTNLKQGKIDFKNA